MNYGNDSFIKDIIVDIGAIAKIGLAIWMRVSGRLHLSILLLILVILGAFFIPMGMTILFVVLKLTGSLTIGWGWIALALVLDGMMMPVYFH